MTILQVLLYIILMIVLIVFMIIIYALVDNTFINDRVKKAQEIMNEGKDNNIEMNKNGYSEKKLTDSIKDKAFDIIFIGSGISCLTCAGLLSRKGYKVLVLEQHDRAGGTTHSFNDKGYEFDTGLHYVGGGVGERTKSVAGYLFHLLSLGSLQWDKMDLNYDTAKISSSLANQHHYPQQHNDSTIKSVDIFADVEITKKNLINLFPNDEEGIKSYFNLLAWSDLVLPLLMIIKLLPSFLGKLLRCLLDPIFLNAITKSTTKEVLSNCTNNINLQGILSYLYGDYGLQPQNSSFLMNAVINNHFLGGAYYPNQGSKSIAEKFIPIIKSSGGEVYVRAPVTKIIIENNKAIGVEIKGNFNVYANKIVSGAGILNTYTKFITADHKNAFADKVRVAISNKNLEKSCAMFTTFIGLNIKDKVNFKDLNIPSKNTWLFPSWDHDKNHDHYDKTCNSPSDFYIPLVFLSSSSAKDKSQHNSDKIVFEMLTVADYDAFSKISKSNKPNHRGKEYDDAKKVLEARMLEIFAEEYPELVPFIEYTASGTPVTNNFYLGSTEGEVYGLSHTPKRFDKDHDWLLRPKQGIDNFYITGQDLLCDGICGGLAAGAITALSISPLLIIDLITTFILSII